MLLTIKVWHDSEGNVLTISLDADHALSVEGAPCSIACFCLPEITAAHNIGFCSGKASPFDFLAIAGVELDGTEAAVKLDELHADDAAASVGDEFFNKGGLVHGFERVVGSRPGLPMMTDNGPLGKAVYH